MTGDENSYFYCDNPVVDRVEFDGRDVLEIGIGRGGFSFEYLGGANSVCGIDPESEAVTYMQRAWPLRFPNTPAEFSHGKIEELSLPRESFDICVFSRSF